MGHTNRPYMDIKDFDLQEGSRVGVKASDGSILWGVVKHFEHDTAAGEVRMTIE